ncbi:MAG: GTPase HflX [Clostridiales Family XIII bacterium]|jgi:GTP-binding protein HflX|nr:GTPase HflX [Clostridiales Family XIII bacterium]
MRQEVENATNNRCIIGVLKLQKIKEEEMRSLMGELSSLCVVSGLEVVGEIEQPLDHPSGSTYFGKGKVDEIAEYVQTLDVGTFVVAAELSGVQLRNLEDKIGCKVVDRTMIVLDIFANRAGSKESKLQVELAQLKYRMPRLLGFRNSLSRPGGGIGTRGPGEKKLETDRRHIHKRIDDIKKELKAAVSARQVTRTLREKQAIPLVALVGYTNAGKSSIMNKLIQLTEAVGDEVYAEDMLFATLDTFLRRIDIEKGKSFILVDTVGFIKYLPHTLIDAFKSTLEEVIQADLLVHVIDSSASDAQLRIDVVHDILHELHADTKEEIYAYNKSDIAVSDLIVGGSNSVHVSALTGDGCDELLHLISEKLFGSHEDITLLIPYEKGDVLSYILEHGTLLGELDYTENGTILTASISAADKGRLSHYELQNRS